MARGVQFLALILAVLLVDRGQAVDFNTNGNVEPEGGLEQTVQKANINRLFDAFLPVLRQMIIEVGMEPLKLMDYDVPVLPLPGKLKGSIHFSEGWMQELSNIKRARDVVASYSNKRMVLDMNLGFSVLDFNYKYLFKYLLVKRTGDVYGRFHDAEARVIVTADLENYHLTLNSIKFTSVRKFDLRFEGRILDPLLNVVTKMITKVFRKRVLETVEHRGFIIFTKVFEDINKSIPVPDRVAKDRLGKIE